MGVKDEYMRLGEEAEAAASASAFPGEVAATLTADLPPFEDAIAVKEELPPMPPVIIEGVLLEGHKMLFTGPSKANKTWGLIALAVSVATGGFWIGMACARRKVLYIDLETDKRTLQRRIAEVTAAKGAPSADVKTNLSVWPLRGKSCGLTRIVDELIARCEPGEYGVIVIDPAYMIQDGDENNARDIREFFSELDRLCVALGCTVVMSHHHSKGAQGLKSSIDRGSGSGVFGRAPDAVVDLTELVLEPGTLPAAREVVTLAATPALTGWRMSFTLREFAPKPPIDVWFAWPLHVEDMTGLLETCKPNYGGLSEARRQRAEQDNADKLAKLEAACERVIGAGDSCLREDIERELVWSASTVKRWVDKSDKFDRIGAAGSGKSKIVRRSADAGD